MKRAAPGVEQRRALAADGLGDQQVRRAREPGAASAVGVELAELEVGQLGAGRVRDHRAGADRPHGLVVRAQSAAAPPSPAPSPARAAAAVGDHAVAALAVAPRASAEAPSTSTDGLGGAGQLGQALGDPPPSAAAPPA